MKTTISRYGRGSGFIASLLAAIISAGCAPQQPAPNGPPTHTITINFEDGCPTDVTPPSRPTCRAGTGFCVKPNEFVRWISHPTGNHFEIYFDPFVGRPYKSHGKNATTTPIPIDANSKEGEYKYSVLGLQCSGGGAVLDPPLRVEY
jgi:hypothetical protein